MNLEIQENNTQIFRFSGSDIRDQKLKILQQESLSKLREDFINNNSIRESLNDFIQTWLIKIETYYSSLADRLEYPSEIWIVSTERDFFHFPSSFLRNINKGWIKIEINKQKDFLNFISYMKNLPLQAVKGEVLSWFSEEPEYTALYRDWCSANKSVLLNRFPLLQQVVFRLNKALFIRQLPAAGKDSFKGQSREGRSAEIRKRKNLSYRCAYQRRRRIFLVSLREKYRKLLSHMFRKNYALPVYSFSLIFFGLILNFYSHSLTLNRPVSRLERESGRNHLYKELNRPDWMKTQNPSGQSLLWQEFFYSINRIKAIPQGESKIRGVFWYEKEFNRQLYLTFDDGPNMEKILYQGRFKSVTSSILDLLSFHHIQAVFFVNGKNLAFRSEDEDREMRILLNRMIREGHLIGNHSYHHYNLAQGRFINGTGDYSEVLEEFELTQRELDRVLGFHYPLVLIRPPYAEPGRTPVLDRILIDKSMFLISLQFDSYDYAYKENGFWQNDRILEHIKEIILPSSGGVVLLHDKENSVYLLEKVLSDPELNSLMSYGSFLDLLENKYPSSPLGRQRD